MAEGCRSTPFVADSGLLKCYIKVSARKRPRPSCGLPARRGRPAQGWECAAGLSDLGLEEHPDRIIHLRIRARMIEERSVKRKKDGGGNTLHDRHQWLQGASGHDASLDEGSGSVRSGSSNTHSISVQEHL